MSKFLFRNTFSARYKIGIRRKYINARTLNIKKKSVSPILVVDLNYLDSLYTSRSLITSKPLSFYFSLWLDKIIYKVLPKGIIFVQSDPVSLAMTQLIIDCGLIVQQVNIASFVFTCRSSGTLLDPFCVITNNLSCWSCSNDRSSLLFCAIDSNNRPIIYDNSTGLDFFSKFLLTNKIINKLGLQHLKYLNLQYLYIILIYICFTNQSKETSFFFDSAYIKKLPRFKHGKEKFSRSSGIALSLVTQAHRFLSYAFLTKSEFMDFFFFQSSGNYLLQLKRLKKLLPLDLQILSHLHSFYQRYFKITSCNLPTPIEIKLTQPISDIRLSFLLEKAPQNYTSLKELIRIENVIKRFLKRYSELPDTLISLLPSSDQTKYKIIQDSDKKKEKIADNINIETESYVSALLLDFFNGES